MKDIINLLVCISIIANCAFAQRPISDQRPASGVEEIVIECQWANVIIKNGSNDQIKLEGTSLINKGENDDAFSFSWKQEGTRIHFSSDIENMDELPKFVSYKKGGQEYVRKLEKGEEVNWSDIRDKNGEGGVTEMSTGVLIEIDLVLYLPTEIFLKTEMTYGDLQLQNVVNAMDVENTYGHVIATFDKGTLNADCSISSTYSFVDVSLPPTLKADLSLQTNYGEIYSDLTFTYDNENSVDEMYHNEIVGVLNNGGKELTLKSPYNNVYLRKKL